MATDYIILECDFKIVKLAVNDIYYIHHYDGLTTFVLTQKEKICHKSLSELNNLLPPNFIRINRNCIVNHLAILELNKKDRQITLINSQQLIVSHRNIKSVTAAIREMALNT